MENVYKRAKQNRKTWFRGATRFLRLFFRKRKYLFLGEMPKEKCVVFSNHVGASCPVFHELYSPFKMRYWGTYEMTESFKVNYKYLSTTYLQDKKGFNKFFGKVIGGIITPFVRIFYRGMQLIPTYKNINFFENPVSLIPASSFSVITAIIVLSASTAYIYSKKRNLEFRKIGIKLNFGKGNKVHSALYYTFYKSLVQQKGLLIIVGFLLIAGFLNSSFTKQYDIQDVYYQYYANELEDKITSETDSFITSEEQRFADLNMQLNEIMEKSNGFSSEANEIQKKLAPEMGFVLIKDRYEQIKNLENAQLFYSF